MPDSGSDSEIEFISARPTSSSAGPSRPRSNLPTSVPNNSTPATASGSHAAQKQAQGGATAVRKVHKVGAWATASTSASSSSIAPSNATASSNAGPAAPINSASAVKSKTMGTTPGQALNGTAVPDRKGKGKARATEVLILDSSDDDHSSGSPIVVQRKPPRASMPSTTSSVQSTTSKEPARRHSLAHHKSSTAPAAAATSSSEPDPLMLAPRATGSDRSMDRPADKTASQVGNGVDTGDTVVRKNTTARKSTGGKFPIQKTAAAGAPSTSIVPPPSAATGPTSSTKPPLSRSIHRSPDGQTQKGNGPSSSSIPQRPRSPSGTGTAPSSTSRLTSTSSSSNTAVKAGESTSTSLSPSKPTSAAATSAARQPAGTAPPRKQPKLQNLAQPNSPDPLAYETGREKNATAAKDALSAPRGTKAAPQPSQPAPPASTSSGLATDPARPAGKPAPSLSAAGSQSARPRPSSDGKIPRTPIQGGASASAATSSGNGPLTTTRALPTASSSQPSRARAGPVTIVDSDSDIEIISPRRKSPAAHPRPASDPQTASKSREDGLSAQRDVVSGMDMAVRDATASTKAAGKAAGPPAAIVGSPRSPEAKVTPGAPKIGTGAPQHASSLQEDGRAGGEARPASGDELEIEDDELFSDEDGDDESMETNGRKLSKRRKRRPAHMKEYQIFPGGRKGRHKLTTAEGEYVQKSVAIGEDCARPDGVKSGAVQKVAAGLSATAAPLDAQDPPLECGAGSTRQAASSLGRGSAVASIARFSKRLPSVEMTAEDLDKLKLSDSAATTDREQEQPKTVPRVAPAPSGTSSAQQAVAGKAGAPTLVEDVEMSDAQSASDTSKGDNQNASNPSSTSSSPAPEHSQPRQAKLGRGRKSTGRRPPQAQILSTQARRLAAELAAQRTAEQGVDQAGASGVSNASFTSAGADEREDGGRSSRGGSHTSTVSSTAPTSASAVKAVPVGLGQSLPDVPMAEIESAAGSGAETTTGSEAPIRAFTTARKSYGRRMIVQSSPSVVGDSEIDSASASDEDSDEDSPSADDADRVAEGNGQIPGPEGPDRETARASTLETAAKQSMPISIRDGLVRRAGAARKSYGPKPPRPRSDSCPDIDPVELDSQTDEASEHSDLTDLSDSATDDSVPDVQSRRGKQAALKIRAAHESLSAARARRQAGAARASETSPTPLAADEMTNNDDLSRRASKLSVQEVNEDRRQSRHRRSRRSSASLSEAQPDDETSTRVRPSKRRRTEMPKSGIHSIDLVKLIREEKLPLILTPADIDRSDPAALEEQRNLIVKFKEREKRKHPWQRQICGPSYDFSSEFHTEIQDAVNRREKRWAKLHPDELPIRSEYRAMFEAMIIEALSLEYPPLAIDARPKIRVCPPTDLPPEAMPTPPFDFIYTNRVVYDEDIAPVQAPGCGCKGDCNSTENRRSCSCLARQIKACTTKVGGTDRSDHKDFAYDRHGRLKWRVFETHDQIIECNSMCGCGPECINRVVGNRKSISVDIFWTGIAGWGVRLPPSYPGHYQRRSIKRGEPLAIYAGELLRTNDAYQRDDHVYSVIGRNYIYDLDAWTVMEDVETLLPRSTVADLKAKTPPPADSQIKTTQKNKGKKGKSKKNTMLEELQLIEDSKSISPLYSMDAFNMGNWTRFCNHVCADWNTKTRPVYIDEADLSRPLFVYFACRDIQPGEEITITYFGGDDEVEDKNLGYTDAEWKVLADKVREEAPPGHRCYCGKKLCRGRMFDVPADEPMFWQVPNS